MVGVEAATSILLLKEIQDWLVQYWIENEPDPDYRIALSSLLNALWPKSGKDAKPSFFPLPSLCGYALGKVSSAITAVNAAWVLLFVASYLLDKIEDEETNHPIFTKYSPGVVANLTTGLILHSGRILSELGSDFTESKTMTEIRREFHRQAIEVCVGQHHDLTIKQPSFEQVWWTVDAKSGKFFALGAYLGARLATPDLEIIDKVSEVGRRMGIINQINNDLFGLGRGEDTSSDLASGKQTLPTLYALHVLPPEKRALLVEYLHKAVHEPTAEVEARRMILSAGAAIYLSLEAVKQRQQAELVLESLQLPPERSTPLYNLVSQPGTRPIIQQ